MQEHLQGRGSVTSCISSRTNADDTYGTSNQQVTGNVSSNECNESESMNKTFYDAKQASLVQEQLMQEQFKMGK
jgi:hypothetical protein